MLTEIIWILFALLLLFAGAEGLVRGSASLGLRAGLSPLAVGLTIVAFGTSAPELFVSTKAALAGQGDIALGNVVGSNIFNIAIILGVTALICPIPVNLQIIRVDGPIALAVALLVPLLLFNDVVSRVEGLLLFAGIVAYTVLNLRASRRASATIETESIAVPATSRHWSIDLGLVVVGLGVLILGSDLLVDHAVSIARGFGVSEAVIGLTLVAAGTSMPELATSLVAAFRRQPDIAIGNVVGSNVFNILSILGITALITPIEAAGLTWIDLGTMILVTALLLALLFTGRRLIRLEGSVLLAIYGAYLFLLWPA